MGGYTQVPEGLDAIHATRPVPGADHGGEARPIVPATALRGALRETLEALLRGAGEKACSGGDGLEPGSPGKTEACTLGADGGPCLACRIFGSQGAEVTRGYLSLGDAVLPPSRELDLAPRYNVALNRKRRSARHGMLKQALQPMVDPGVTFVAEGFIDARDDEAVRAFEAAVMATHHVGSGRSRGNGRVALELRWVEPDVRSEEIDGPDLRVVLELQAPAHVGRPLKAENVRSTRREIPGSVMRGAIGWQMARILGDDHPALATLAGDQVVFDFAYPVPKRDDDEKRDYESARSGVPGPWPLTMIGCKKEPGHFSTDTLVFGLAQKFATEAGQIRRVQELMHDTCPAKGCGAPLRKRSGVRSGGKVETRTVTRVSLDRRRSSARHGRLFTHELIEAGTRFEATIRNVPEGVRHALAETLSSGLYVGRGSSLGWGMARVVEVGRVFGDRVKDLRERGEGFARALGRVLEHAGIHIEGAADRLVQLTLLSPMLVGRDGVEDYDREDGTRQIVGAFEALGLGPVEVLFANRRFGMEGVWPERGGHPELWRSVVAGSVYVVRVAAGWRSKETLKLLQQLQGHGIGPNGHMGFGRVLCFDPIISETRFK